MIVSNRVLCVPPRLIADEDQGKSFSSHFFCGYTRASRSVGAHKRRCIAGLFRPALESSTYNGCNIWRLHFFYCPAACMDVFNGVDVQTTANSIGAVTNRSLPRAEPTSTLSQFRKKSLSRTSLCTKVARLAPAAYSLRLYLTVLHSNQAAPGVKVGRRP
jgi:hypothetical protein